MTIYKELKGLIYLLIISGMIVFIFLMLDKGNNNEQALQNSKLIDSLKTEKIKDLARIEFLNFVRAELEIKLSELNEKETVIKNNNTNYKKNYSSLNRTYTDSLYLSLFK